MQRDAVILFSHGSLLCGAGEALEAHATRLRGRGLASRVEVGYLNYTEPSFAEAAERCIAGGATRLLVAPYFLAPGYFVRVSLPKAVALVQEQHPDVELRIAEPMGYSPLLVEAVLASASAALPPERWFEELHRAALCQQRAECPLYGSRHCQERLQEPPTVDLAPSSPSAVLLLLAHGSPNPAANEDLFRVVEEIRARRLFAEVQVGFLECNAPSIPEAIDRCGAQGAVEVVAVPYFLHTGTHVAEDLPTLLEAGRQRYPHLSFRLGAYLGRSEPLTHLLEARIREAVPNTPSPLPSPA